MATRRTSPAAHRSTVRARPLVRRGRPRRGALAALGAMALAGVLVGTAGAEDSPGDDGTRPAETVNVQILSFNDFHGHLEPPGGADGTLSAVLDPLATPVGGAEYLASTLAQLREGHPASLTVAAGDLIGGSPFLSGLFHDEPSVESLEAMQLDVSGVGNHEFDEGLTELLRMQQGGCHPFDGCYFPGDPYDGADFPWLAANVRYARSAKTILPGTSVRTVDGVKVGFIGMTLEGTPELVAQSGIQGLRFEDEVETANRAAALLRSQGVVSIVVLLHEGGLQTGTYDRCAGISGPVVDIAEHLDPEIDLVVTGHTHQPYVCTIADPNGNPRLVTSASSYGRVVTETTLPVDARTGQVRRSAVTATNHLVTRTVAKDPTQTAIIAKWSALAAPRGNQVVGSVTADITRSPNRDSESSLANLIADAQLAATAAPGDGGARIALMNPGGVRADLTVDQISGGEQPGQITFGEAFAVQPFGNLLVTMDLTGAQLHDVLEQQAVATRSRPVLVLGVSKGFTFSYAASAPFGERIDPASMQLDGAPIDPAGTYRVTVNNFLADGGDAFTVFTEGTNRLGGGDDLVAFTDYLEANSPVQPAPTDRIVELP
ncbi:MAG: bifunctional metallophosphatase/5'-nucleotidase [Acidimicrobiales bacterium]|nr:bifunctional metallophosphatase/5'-nucleotidase [Acidimicrobiales bacterium]